MPLVGPRIEDRSGQTAADDRIEMPADHLGLFLLGVADRVHSELAHDQGLVLRKILQAGQVALEVLAAVQVDVEGQEVDVLRQQILGRRIARVGVEGAGILAAGDVDQMLDEFRHTLRAQPAYHRRGDLVAEQVAEDRVMPPVLAHGVDDGLLHRGANLRIVEELHMLHPGDAEEDADAVLQAEIEEPAGRGRVDADQIGPCLADGCQILGDLLLRSELVSLGVGREGGIGHPLDKKFLFTLEEELRADNDALSHRKVSIGERGRSLARTPSTPRAGYLKSPGSTFLSSPAPRFCSS